MVLVVVIVCHSSSFLGRVFVTLPTNIVCKVIDEIIVGYGIIFTIIVIDAAESIVRNYTSADSILAVSYKLDSFIVILY